jgi:hemolytic protein hlpA-like protein
MPRIIQRLAKVKPRKVYILADEGRNEKEIEQAHECRKTVESLINWDCEVVKNYAEENRGVYRNIGEGAKWVFEREEKAIFLEDDNLPETSFFRYADEMLEKYETAPEVLWICGTNYVTDMNGKESYAFTQHLLPCGWASWSTKFLKYYDGELSTFRDEAHKRKFYSSYSNRWLAQWQYQSVRNEVERHERTGRFISWDYQMLWSVRSNGLYGVVPLRNQITNIGVDEFSIHGGNSKNNVMTDRFCEVPSKQLDFPLVHPNEIAINKSVEHQLADIICPPHSTVLKSLLSSKMKRLMKQDTAKSWKQILKEMRR